MSRWSEEVRLNRPLSRVWALARGVSVGVFERRREKLIISGKNNLLCSRMVDRFKTPVVLTEFLPDFNSSQGCRRSSVKFNICTMRNVTHFMNSRVIRQSPLYGAYYSRANCIFQVSWNKPSASSYSGSISKDTSIGIPKYDTTFGRSRNDASKKVDDDKTASRIASKYGSAYSTGYQRDSPAMRDTGYTGRTESSRIKPLLDKKDTSHPPVTYRPLIRTGSRSRDPSPVENYNYNRLYPRPYQRSESSNSSSTIPKYTGRTSIGREETPRYSGRSSLTKDDVPKYMGRLSASKEDSVSRYKVPSRNPSREDLSSGSQNYTAYTRSSTARTNETSRKNRELLSVLHAQQEQERLSRSSSRCSSIAPEDSLSKEQHRVEGNPEPLSKEVEMETITVVTRGTSPTPTTQNTSFLRSRRIEVAKVVEKRITRPKRKTHTMVDKEMQSDRLDDSTKTSRFAGASRISATPWSSILDMKFSSPSSKQKALNRSDSSSQEDKRKDTCGSPKSISRTSSTKSVSQSSSKSDKSKEVKKSPSPAKSKIVPPKQISSDKKLLPPQIPKSENSSKSNSLHSLLPTNKDFRKSVLNMNPDGKSNKKIGRRSNSASSAESDVADPDVTDVSENLATCKSYHNSSSSKLPQKVSSDKSARNRRSPSSDASTSSHATSSSEDDQKTKNENIKLQSAGSSRTSVVMSSADELSIDKSPKPPQSPRQKTESIKTEAEAKSFLMRALAPVTNLFKVKHVDSTEKVNWMDPSSESTNDQGKVHSPSSTGVPACGPVSTELIPAKIIIHRVESDEKPWWMEEKSEESAQDQGTSQKSSQQAESSLQKPAVRHVESGELPWWLDEQAQVPEGVETYPNWVREDGTTADGRVIYKIRKNDSDDTSWWLSSSEKTNTDSNKNKSANIMDAEYLEKHKIRHIDSGERAWWLNSTENISEMVQAKEDVKQSQPKFAIHHQDSDEKHWWLQQKSTEEGRDSDNEFDHDQVPLGDRASPDGLEMPKNDEGRHSPYDNVPQTRYKSKRPSQLPLFISKHTNIDDILGGSTQMWSPLMDRIFSYGTQDQEECTEIDAGQVIIHDGTAQSTVMQPNR
ncbi:hypothetical protein NQ318_016831, partial [Aromia moschata]